MRRIFALAAALLIAAAPSSPEPPAWLEGVWVSEQGDKWTEERWSPARGGTMLGTALSGRGGRATGYEFMRIVSDPDGGLTFWGSPGGKTPVPFRLVSSSATGAVFENRTHDFPQRIAYRRSGDTLVATISAADGSKAESWAYARR